MQYRFQVCLDKGKKSERWEDVHPAGKPDQPYEYETRDEAERMARICYGDDASIVRIRELGSEPSPISWKAEVLTVGGGDKWSTNALRFATQVEAASYALDLAWRWTSVTDTRATPSDDPVTHTYHQGVLDHAAKEESQ